MQKWGNREYNRDDRKSNDKVGNHFVAMSGSAFEEDVKRSLDAGMDGHLAKPLDVDKFIRILEKNS